MPAHGARSAALASSSHGAPSPRAAWRALRHGAAERYRAGGRFALHFACGKLGHDPVFRALLERGVIAPGARVLDIGCGQALLASLLAQCETLAAAGGWPAVWGPAPAGTRYSGIDLMPRDIARAERALASLAPRVRLRGGDMRVLPFDPSDVVLVLDVLHYMDHAAQREVLQRVGEALAPHGHLLLRVGDAGQGWRFAVSQWVDRAVTWVRGHRAPPTWGRTLTAWHALLHELGFGIVETLPMSRGTPFANVLLVCMPKAAAR